MLGLLDADVARGTAEGLLGTASDRWRHVVGVAAAARAVARVVPHNDVALLVAAAWLHDIGYSPAIAHTGFHPLDGALHLRDIGAPERLCNLVAFHSGALVEARHRRMRGGLLIDFAPEESVVADALTFVDMTTSPTGQPVTVDERLAEILRRYPRHDPVHRAVTESSPHLRALVARVEARLAVGQPR
ncbi:MAG TPA: HD domain-containing protein [Actinomycetaceae bacterium]|nr:HD domain-containing protein [Actinomycetaceae bacterium]